MLLRLEIHDLAIVTSLTFEPGEGLVVLSGETGAGKSVVAKALALLAGERGGPSLVRSGCDQARVIGEWSLDGQALRIERRVPGRASINGAAVPLARLKELAPRLMGRTGQHDQRLLLDEAEHRGLLDRFGALDLGRMHRASAAWSEARQRLAELRLRMTRREERMHWLSFQLEHLDELAPLSDEAERLDEELGVLRHAAELRGGLANLDRRLYADEGAVGEQLGKAESALRHLAGLDPRLEPNLQELVELGARVEDLAHSLRGASPTLDPERLAQGEARLAALREAEKRHRVADLVAHRQDLRAELDGLERLDEDAKTGAAAVTTTRARAEAEAEALHRRRKKTGTALEKALGEVLGRLGMPDARVRTRLEPAELGPFGHDAVVFELSANPGEDPRPLARIASGGELSRVLFALRRLLSPDLDSWLFDEVDAGIGGRVAESLADELKRLAEGRQVICITHLPTVAAAADHHFAVAKAVLGGRTRATLRRLDTEGRIDELARMIGGPPEASRPCAGQLLHARAAGRRQVA